MSWLAVEPDVALAVHIRGWTADQDIANAAVLTGTLADVPTESTYDSILYIDVLEHIDEDSLEVRRAFDHLRPGGRLIILVPAHQFLYSPFDASIGHFRRYNKSSLTRLQPPHSMQERLIYLDSVGLLASLTNKLLLRSAMPTAGQIRLWDRVLVRGSKVLDPLLAHSLGKSLLVVWRRPL
jgi:SAM-dependent methyltransferase